MLSFKHRDGLHGDSIPNMNGRVPAHLPGGHKVLCGMQGQTEDVVCVSAVVLLLVCGSAVHNAQGSNMVDHVAIGQVVQVITAIVATVTIGMRRDVHT